MRTRTNLIIEEKILAKIDALAGDRNKRAAVIETALLEYIARQESKSPADSAVEANGKKAMAKV